MIDKFPHFSKLDISHKSTIEAITIKFEPYSDFNFVSLFCWNTDGSTEISILNDNLIIRLPDYITAEPVFSLIGDSKIDDSLLALLQHTKELKLVPEVVVKNIKDSSRYKITEDPDNFDYIYKLHEHAHLPGAKFSHKRKKAAHFSKNHHGRFAVRPINLNSNGDLIAVLDIFDKWAKSKNNPVDETKQERIAISKLLDNASLLDLVGSIMTIDEQPVGFSLYEVIGSGHVLCHFHKSIARFKNIDVYFTSAAAKDLIVEGHELVNWEQDLGLEGLKHSKMSYRPVYFLKKYRISLA